MIGEIFQKVQDFFGGGENFIKNLHGEGILIGRFLFENKNVWVFVYFSKFQSVLELDWFGKWKFNGFFWVNEFVCDYSL